MHLNPLIESIRRITGREISEQQTELLLQTLGDREKDIIIRRWGLLTGKPEPTKEVAGLYNLTGNRIRQIEAKAHRKLCSALKVQVEAAGKEILDQPIEVLNFSTRALNCLRRDLRPRVRDLTEATAYGLLSIRNFGKRQLEEVRAKLTERGLKLKDD